jgi:F-type H+-transporting ATPase subunit gamma
MANLKEIQRQIKSVKNTQKTTKAMKLVSTAKLRRTEELAKKSKVYASKLSSVLTEIACNIEKYKSGGIESPFFASDEDVKKVDIVFITADKGLCGGFNMQTIKAVKKLMSEYAQQDVKVRLRAIGRKGIDFFNFQEVGLHDQKVGLSSAPTYEDTVEFVSSVTEDFKNGVVDKVVLVYNGFKNMLTQELRTSALMPIDTTVCEDIQMNSLMDIEPEDDESVLESLITKYIEFSLYYALLDSLAAEHSARMQAMDAATSNAKEMANSLTVKYNKARQEAITTELIEIISGVESMK